MAASRKNSKRHEKWQKTRAISPIGMQEEEIVVEAGKKEDLFAIPYHVWSVRSRK